MKKLALLLASVTIASAAMAQISITGSSLTYTQDFNSLDTLSATPYNTALPTGWALAETGTNANSTYRGGAGASNAGDTYSFGTSGSTERALGGVASGSLLPAFGARFVNNTGAAITHFDVTYHGEQWRLGNPASHTDTLYFMYSTNATSVGDAAATWTEASALTLTSVLTSGTAAGATDGNTNFSTMTGTVTVNIPNGATLTIKWMDPNIIGSDDALAVDDLSITFANGAPPPPTYNPNLITVTPADNSSNVATTTNTLTMTFDRMVSKGTGNIVLYNETDQTNQTFNVTSADVTLNGGTIGDVVTISNVVIALSKTYHVMYDSTAFDTAGYKSAGIYDTTTWNFAAATPPPPPVTSLDENFDASCGATPSNLPSGWMKYSVVGSQQWNCYSFGYSGTPCAQMNGYQSGNNVNEDWLITPKMDLSAMTNAYFQFRAFKKFSGDDLTVLTSSDYIGAGDPNAATWTNLNVNFANADTNWHIFQADLTPYKATPMYVAFKYISTANDGAQWKVDNVMTSGTNNIINFSKASLEFAVLGNATTSEFTIGYKLEAGKYTLSVYDITGREVHTQSMNIQSGAHRTTVSGLNLNSGMYLIKLSNGNTFGVAKAIVQ